MQLCNIVVLIIKRNPDVKSKKEISGKLWNINLIKASITFIEPHPISYDLTKPNLASPNLTQSRPAIWAKFPIHAYFEEPEI
jgi:hypothetical protein